MSSFTFDRVRAACGTSLLAIVATALAAPAAAQAPGATPQDVPRPGETGTQTGTTQAGTLGADGGVVVEASGQPGGVASIADDGGAGEDIVVTGFRASVAAALTDKRQATGVVDVIRAEDIADFPDNNLAESLQRIPGVAISREGGEGRSILVRGLGPNFTRVRINGMEAIATTGGSDAGGGVNRGRGFDFNVFASELFNSLTVRKTSSASVEEGSLGATVDLQAARPFDYRDQLVVAASAQAGYNDLSRAVDPRFAGLVSWQNADSTIGGLLSAAYSRRTVFEEGHSTVRWGPTGDNGGFAPTSTLPGYTVGQINARPANDGSNWDSLIYHPRIPRYDQWENRIERLGITGALQFRPGDRTLLTLEGLYSRSRNDRLENYISAISFSRTGAAGKPQTIIRDGVVDADNTLVYGVFDNVDMRIESRQDELESTFRQLTATLSHEFSDAFTLTAFGGLARSRFANPIQTTITLDRENSNGFSWDYRRDSRNPVMNWGFDLTDPANWSFRNGVSDVRLRENYVDNDFDSAKLFGEYQVTQGFGLLFGGEYRRFTFDSREIRRNVGEIQSGTLTPAQVAALTTVRSGLTGDPSQNAYLIPNLQGFVDTLDIYCNCVTTINGQRVDFTTGGLTNATARSNTSNVREEALAAYFQTNFELPLGDFMLRGDAGMRYVQTRQRSTGFGVVNNQIEQLSVDRRYDNWLPAMNLVMEFTPELYLRFGASKVITRPGLGSLSPGGSLTIQPSNRVVSTGNPFLDPTEATALDVSAEWYFATGSLLGIGLFQKDISTLAGTQSVSIVPFTQTGLPLDLLTGTGVTADQDFELRQVINGDGGRLRGFEVNYQHQLRFLPSFLSNLGVLANYTFVDANLIYPPLGNVAGGAPVIGPLLDLSRHSANGTLFYEDSVLNLRGSVAYRSGYIERFGGGARDRNVEEGVNANIQFDASASVQLTPWLALTAEAINIFNEPKDQYIGAADRVVLNHIFGRQFYFGVRTRF